jgi:hypothetical protein
MKESETICGVAHWNIGVEFPVERVKELINKGRFTACEKCWKDIK